MSLERFKKLGGIVTVVLLLNICCSPCDTDQRYFSVIDMFIRNVERQPDGTHSFADLPDGTIMQYQSFSIMLTVGVEYLADQTPLFNSFLTPVYGCDAPAPLANDKIEDIELTCYADFLLANGDTIFAGERLNPYFDVSGEGIASSSLSQFLNTGNPLLIEEPTFLSLNTPPVDNQSHRFSVKYRLNNGKRFQASTRSIMILK